MSFFSRKSAAPSASSATAADTKFGPATSDLLSEPVDGVKPTKKWTYNEEQLKQIAELQEYTKTLILPSDDAYYAWESRFLADPGTHPRFMRAAKWKMDDAKRRIKGTIEWRREFKPELIQPGDVGVEAETGKIVILHWGMGMREYPAYQEPLLKKAKVILTGFDEDARPVLYLRPGRENTKPSPRQIRHMIYFLERAIDLMPPGQEQVCIIVDYKSATSGSMPSISTGRQVLSILQNHYVERMGRGLVVNMPWWMNAFFAGISPLMDPITRDKIRFNPVLTELVPGPHLDKEFGGSLNFEYDYKTYWPQLTKFCHLAEDGTRVTAEGETFYPPAGNGIAAAAAGILPKAGAVTSGETTTEPADSVQPGGIKTPASFGGATGPAGTPAPSSPVNGTSPALVGASTANGESSDETGLEKAVEKLAVDAAEPPAVETKPGEPEGEVVFDHPPSEAEKVEAAALTKA